MGEYEEKYFSRCTKPYEWYVKNIIPPVELGNLSIPFGKLVLRDIWYVNLPERKDRNIETIRELDKAQVPQYTRIDGIPGERYPSASALSICCGGGPLHENIIKHHKMVTSRDGLRSEETKWIRNKAGCTMSQWRLWQAASQYNSGWVIIMEDDYTINYNWDVLIDNVNMCIDRFPDSDIIVLGDRQAIAEQFRLANSNLNWVTGSHRNGGDGYMLKCSSITPAIADIHQIGHPDHDPRFSNDANIQNIVNMGKLTAACLEQPWLKNYGNHKAEPPGAPITKLTSSIECQDKFNTDWIQ